MYSKKRDQEVYTQKNNGGEVVAKLGFAEKVKVLETDGRWVKVESRERKMGWIYSGSLGTEPPPSDNKNNTGAAAGSESNAARGLSDEAKKYAERSSIPDAAEQVEWMEQENDKVTQETVRDYMKEKQLGEFGS